MSEYRISETVGERNAMGAENHMQPTEAVTRENGDLVESLMKGEPFPDMRLYTPELDTALTGYQLIRHETRDAIIAALSTHQQQGADGNLIETIQAHIKACLAEDRNFTANVLQRAADALSRALQPDTVTEEMVRAGWAAIVGDDIADTCQSAHIIKADLEPAITAALAAR